MIGCDVASGVIEQKAEASSLLRGDRCIWFRRSGQVIFERGFRPVRLDRSILPPDFVPGQVVYSDQEFLVLAGLIASKGHLNAIGESNDGLSITIEFE